MASTVRSFRITKFLKLMNGLLGNSLEWLCSVRKVKEVQPYRFDINMGPCLLLLWRVNVDHTPWLLLRELDKELGRGTWWYGQGKPLLTVEIKELSM